MIVTTSMKLRNKKNEEVNPATEDTLQTINTNVAKEATLQDIDSKVATENTLSEINNKVATEDTLSQLNNKVATETTLQDIDSKVATEATLSEINNKVATEDTLQAISMDVAKEATLQDIDSKVATEETLSNVVSNTANIGTPLQDNKIAQSIPQESTGEPRISINKDNVGLAKDGLIARDRVTITDEFIASGNEVAFKSYTVDSGHRTMVRGRLEVFDTLVAKGLIKVEGLVRVGGI